MPDKAKVSYKTPKVHTQVNSNQAKNAAKENNSTKMEIPTQVISKKEANTAKVNLSLDK